MSMELVFEKYFPFWKELNDVDKKYLQENTTTKHFDKEQSVHSNMECSGVFIVKSGKLRLYMCSDEGKEITLYRLSPGEMCMLSASCVLQSITFDVFVDTETSTDCYIISGAAFNKVAEKVPAMKIFALEAAVSRFSDVMWIMQQIVFMNQDKRLAIFLLEVAESKGDNIITLTHEQIARHLGTAREVVSRMLKHLASDGVLEVTRKGINIIDIKKLRNIAY